VSDGLDRVRAEVARSRGLADGAAGFLSGHTIEEIEASADAFAQLRQTSADRRVPDEAAAPDFFTGAAIAKADRQAELRALFAGRASQERDEAGRFTTSGGFGFDGGARQTLPQPPPGHGAWLGEVLRSRAADRGAAF
jgi:hypothetical protein